MFSDTIRNYVIIGVIVLIISAVGFYFAFQSSVPQEEYKQTEQTKISGSEPAKLIPPKTEFKIEFSGRNKVTVYWENLSSSTVKLVIFRKKDGSKKWSPWQTIPITGGNSGGSKEFDADNPSQYEYYAQGYSSSGGTTWASPESRALPPESGTGGAFPSGASPSLPLPAVSGVEPSSSSSPPSSSSLSLSSPVVTCPEPCRGSGVEPSSSASPSSSLPTASTSTSSETSSAPVYYSPDQQSSNSSAPQTDSFWVQYVNKNIEVGWQNLPPQSDEIKVYRSASSSGGWVLLLDQKKINAAGPTHIRLVDSTINGSYYYKMDAYSAGTVVAAYDPVFLAALQE